MLSYLYNAVTYYLPAWSAAPADKECVPEQPTYNGFIYVVVKPKHVQGSSYLTRGKYKVGRTSSPDRRAREYGKGSLQLALIPKKDQLTSERRLLEWLRADSSKFKLVEGRETFEGELLDIIDLVVRC